MVIWAEMNHKDILHKLITLMGKLATDPHFKTTLIKYVQHFFRGTTESYLGDLLKVIGKSLLYCVRFSSGPQIIFYQDLSFLFLLWHKPWEPFLSIK